jgi:hypothetical protein
LRATPKAAILKPLRHTITIQIVAQFSSSLSRYMLSHRCDSFSDSGLFRW